MTSVWGNLKFKMSRVQTPMQMTVIQQVLEWYRRQGNEEKGTHDIIWKGDRRSGRREGNTCDIMK
jgi:hypothetical protein